jgi:hypothetical protein
VGGLIGLDCWLRQNDLAKAIPIFLFGAVFLLLGFSATWIAAVGGWFFDTIKEQLVLEVFPEKGIAVQFNDTCHLLEWAVFSRSRETPNLIVALFDKVYDVLGIPKCSCTEAQIGELTQLLKLKIR